MSDARDRINALLDDGSFVEIGAYVSARSTDFNLSAAQTPSDGVITGYGLIDGSLVYIYSQDASVMHGSVGEMHARKIVRVYDMAMKVGVPVIGLIDSAGMRLAEATDALDAFGDLYFRQTMASGVIPQIMAVVGTCAGGMALVPAMADFTLMTESASMSVNSPDALSGNTKEKCNTAGAAYQSETAGSVDMVCPDEETLFSRIRLLVGMLPANNEDVGYESCTDDLNRENPALKDTRDTVYILRDIADNHLFIECKPAFAPEMVTGLLRMNGLTVGAIANRCEVLGEDGTAADTLPAKLTADGALKAAAFVRFCDAFEIPILSLVNVSGFETDLASEARLARCTAALTYALSDASVAKVSILIDKAYGSAYLAMNSRHIGADVVFAWPDAQVGMMDAGEAAKIIYADEIARAEDPFTLIAEKTAAYQELQTSPWSAARRGYVDDIIQPDATRKRVIAALEMLYTKREDRPVRKHGTV